MRRALLVIGRSRRRLAQVDGESEEGRSNRCIIVLVLAVEADRECGTTNALEKGMAEATAANSIVVDGIPLLRRFVVMVALFRHEMIGWCVRDEVSQH